MSVYQSSIARQTLTLAGMEAASRARIDLLTQLSDDLLQESEEVDHETAEALKWEASRASSLAFEITRALCHDDPLTAYRIMLSGEVDGTSLRLTA